MTELEARLRAVRERHRAFVPYQMAGASPRWLDHLDALVAAGADAIEVGLPFSDPMMDGPVIQEAALRALAAGTTLETVAHALAGRDLGVPLIAMTYYNVLYHRGLERAATVLRDAGISGAIVPDLPLEELAPWREASAAAGLATVLLVAPSTPAERTARVARASQGFVYASARMAVTGRSDDAGDAPRVVAAIRAAVDTPVYVGIGISTPADAGAAVLFADGAIVGSALVAAVLADDDPAGLELAAAAFRAAVN
ncbi:MAG: tryptophan synthase subunit alpha [Acidimicrobiales bacterium]